MFYPKKYLIENKYTVQRFALYGFDFIILITDKKIPENFKCSFLRDDGEVYIGKNGVHELYPNANIFNRLNDSDIKKFYSK